MYQIHIEAEDFAGKRMVAQHRMVNEVSNRHPSFSSNTPQLGGPPTLFMFGAGVNFGPWSASKYRDIIGQWYLFGLMHTSLLSL